MGELFPRVIETDCLRMEALTPETVDVFEFYEICSRDPGIEEVTRYVTWDPHATPKETLEHVEDAAERFADDDGAIYLIRPSRDEQGAGEIAGDTAAIVDWDRRTMTLGIWLRKRFWGRGYSGERAAAMMQLAFDRLDLEVVSVSHHVDNEPSRRAIERYVEAHGGRREGRLRNYLAFEDEGPVDLVRYTIHRDEWDEHADGPVATFED